MARAPVDDQVLGVLADLGVEVVQEIRRGASRSQLRASIFVPRGARTGPV